MLNLERALELLDLPRNATIFDVRGKYLKLAKEAHPDKSHLGTCTNPKLNQNFIAIKEAYEYLQETLKSKKLDLKFELSPQLNGFVETIDSTDLEYDKSLASYFYICRCGKVIFLNKFEIERNVIHTFTCHACSMRFKIASI